ncbi:MAG TPA: hypothetical protein VMR18_02335 [Candidatus Saccharimonadales bacterium]|nr:hypothetical protein [Candidatus Saccharimonadales bacterium]
MDDQGQKPEASQPLDPQPSNSPPQNQSKVLRPSQSFVEEMKSAASPALPVSQPALTPQAQNNQNAVPQAQTLKVDSPNSTQPAVNSVYPEISKGFGISNSQAVASPEKKPSTNSKSNDKSMVIKILITILGVYIASSALLGLFAGLKLLSFGIARSTGGILTVIDIVYLVVGAGIVFRREIARIVYVVLAVVGLVLSSVGLYSYIHATSGSNSLEQQSKQSIIASTNKEIANYESSTTIPTNQKTQIIQEIKNTENNELNSPEYPTVTVKKTIVPIIEGYAIAIIPLIFLTRPSVKEEFN